MGGRVEAVGPLVFSSMTIIADQGRLIPVLVARDAGRARRDDLDGSLPEERGRATWT
jgi:hypothetical protein